MLHTRALTVPCSSVVALALAAPAESQDQQHPTEAAEPTPRTLSADKSGYSIFNPTPRDLWRPMSADRPDFTESPYTVDAGALQLEMSFADYAWTNGSNTLVIAPANMKVGLLNNVDLQFVFDPYIRFRDGTQTDEGFGDMQVRCKVNLWGNDDGSTALAVMPFIVIPTASGDVGTGHVEGGLIFPFAMGLTETIGFGLMFETDFVYDVRDASYDTDFVTTGVVGVDITEMLGMYVEGIGIASTDSDIGYRAFLGVGATVSVTDNLMFDAGVNIGLTNNVDDFSVFTGMTVRF